MNSKELELFKNDVLEGLSSKNKFLPSKYFYDECGDELFMEIMNLPEYYLTNCEYEILDRQSPEIIKNFDMNGQVFDLIEFGPGDASKTKLMISTLLENGIDFKYVPIDISPNVIEMIKADFRKNFSSVKLDPRNDDFFRALEDINISENVRKVVLFMGSNIGNFKKDDAVNFLKEISSRMHPKDNLLIGIDLKKNPELILNAYNDSRGITAEFNYNLLRRINRELGADFVIENFIHYPVYSPETGEARSYLVSKKEQTVEIKALKKTFHFAQWEHIFMELSRKFDLDMIEEYAGTAGFEIVKNFFDSKNYFVNSLWKLK